MILSGFPPSPNMAFLLSALLEQPYAKKHDFSHKTLESVCAHFEEVSVSEVPEKEQLDYDSAFTLLTLLLCDLELHNRQHLPSGTLLAFNSAINEPTQDLYSNELTAAARRIELLQQQDILKLPLPVSRAIVMSLYCSSLHQELKYRLTTPCQKIWPKRESILSRIIQLEGQRIHLSQTVANSLDMNTLEKESLTQLMKYILYLESWEQLCPNLQEMGQLVLLFTSAGQKSLIQGTSSAFSPKEFAQTLTELHSIYRTSLNGEFSMDEKTWIGFQAAFKKMESLLIPLEKGLQMAVA